MASDKLARAMRESKLFSEVIEQRQASDYAGTLDWLRARRAALFTEEDRAWLASRATPKALGETHNAGAVPPLGELLDDSDPAMQYRAVLALQQATGKDLGNDVSRWQAYVKNEQPKAAPTWAERAGNWFK